MSTQHRIFGPSLYPVVTHISPLRKRSDIVRDLITSDIVRSRTMTDSILALKSILFESNDPLRPLTQDNFVNLNDVGVKLTETF
jgi:hypothetical protein